MNPWNIEANFTGEKKPFKRSVRQRGIKPLNFICFHFASAEGGYNHTAMH